MRYEFFGMRHDTAFAITDVVDKWRLAGLNCKALAVTSEIGLYDVMVNGTDIAIIPMGEDGFKFENLKSTESIYVNVDDMIELTIS